MTWTQTHERFRLLNEAEDDLRVGPTGRLPWSPAYAEAFGTPNRLAEALRHRWRTRFEAQLDPALSPEDYAATFADLTAETAPLMGRLDVTEIDAEPADASA